MTTASSGKIAVAQQLIEIGSSCGETAGLLDLPYLRDAHQRRQRIAESAGSASIDGRQTTAERLYAWLGDIPVEGQRNLGAEVYAAGLFAVLVGQRKAEAAEARGLAEDLYRRVGGDPVAGAAALFRGQDAISAESRAAYFWFLRRCLGPAEPAISSYFAGLGPAAKRPARAFETYIADRLWRASRQALINARTLKADLGIVYATLGSARRSSHIHRIAETLFGGHPLTFGSCARIFGISRLTARKHLLALERQGLAVLATRRKSGRVYVAQDGLMSFMAPAPSPPPRQGRLQVVQPLRPYSESERARLENAAEEVAAQLRDLDRALERVSAVVQKR